MAEQPSQWWYPIVKWAEDNTLIFLVFGLAWRGIDKAFKYLSSTQAERIRTMVKDEIQNHVAPEINRLTQAINELRESIWNLKDKK